MIFGNKYRRALLCATLLLCSGVAAHAAGLGSWTVLNDPQGSRTLGTVTLLQNGQVLVAGGTGTSGVDVLAELFDPATNTYTPTTPLQTARTQAAAVRLADGRVLVVAGNADSAQARPLASAEIYDPKTASWTYTGSLHEARFGHQAVLLRDGRVLVTGGTPDVDTQLRTCEIWDPATGVWTYTGSMAVGRRYSSAVTLPDGNVLEAGDDASAELYTTATGTWRPTPRTPEHVFAETLTVLKDGTVLAPPSDTPSTTGPGMTYDEHTNRWTDTGSSTGRFYPADSLLADGSVLIAGGCTRVCSNPSVASAVRYNPAKRSYIGIAKMNYGRQSAAAVTLPDGRVLVQGGFGQILGPPPPEVYTP